MLSAFQTRLPHLQIRKELAKCTYGSILLVTSQFDNGLRVVKYSMVSNERVRSTENPFNEAKFLLEVAKKGHHSSIVSVFEHGVVSESDNGENKENQNLGVSHHFLLMEYLSGSTLSNVLNMMPLREPFLRCLIRQILSAVAFLHHLELAHLDICPENLMFSDDTYAAVKLIDFGRCQSLAEKKTIQYPFRQALPTDIHCIAPECFDRNNQSDAKAVDVYAVGAVLFFCMFQRPPLLTPNEASPPRTFLAEGKITQVLDSLKITKNKPSEAALDFMSRVLCSPEQRLTAAEALKHPWLLL